MKKKYNFSSQDISDICNLYINKTPTKVIASNYKCSTDFVYTTLEKNDIERFHSDFAKINYPKHWKGKKFSKETCKKISEGHKGQTAWNKGLSGDLYSSHYENKHPRGMLGKKSWNKGLTKQNDEKTKIIHIKRMNTCKERGYVNSPETRKKISDSRKGKKWEDLDKNKERLDERITKLRFRMLGEHNPLWCGGKSFEPYTPEFNEKFKNEIRKRDNQVCMNCGIHREKINRSLDTHHINYDKQLSIPENCISLCRNCHLLTNGNREYWTKLFQDKLSKLYGYKYSEGKVIINLDNINDNDLHKKNQ